MCLIGILLAKNHEFLYAHSVNTYTRETIVIYVKIIH